MKKKKMADFNDQEAVLDEVARDLDVDPDDLSIESDSLSDFGAGEVYRITLGNKEYGVVENEEQMHALAIAIVKQDLEEEPSIFNQEFIEQHIDTEHLRKELHADVYGMRLEDLLSLDADDFWREYEREGLDVPEEDEDGDLPEPSNAEIEDLAERQTEESLRNPMEYLEEIYGREDAVKKAIEIAGIDIDAAAEDAVQTDGAEHFVARYDGDSHETPSGFVYWRDN